MRATLIRDPSGVAEARRNAVAVALALGFDTEDAGRVALVATELASNLVKHAAGGDLLIGMFEDSTGWGVELLALDKGCGIADLRSALRDGHSTAGSAGTGLGAIHRGSHDVDCYTQTGAGTAILARLQPGRAIGNATAARPWYGAVDAAKPGEDMSGDAWCCNEHERGFRMMVADGLGHGPGAAEAARVAVQAFRERPRMMPGELLDVMHKLLQPTRGAAIAIADVDRQQRQVIFAGLGNVSGTLITDQGARQMVSLHGTVGHVAKRVHPFVYSFDDAPTIVLCSDGLGTSWTLDNYPALRQCHPTLIAGVLYRDFNRGRDDVTVLVAKPEPA